MRQPLRVQIVTLALLIEAMWMFGYATWRVFGDNPPEISGGTAGAYGALLGSFAAAVFGLYQWARSRRDK